MKNNILFLVLILYIPLLRTQPSITSDEDFLLTLQKNNLWHPGMSLKLHLGCGGKKLEGYINIDFPLSEHTVQTQSGAEIFADITTLKIPAEVVDEIRSHHVFEHFDRPTALALLCMWHTWLKPNGILCIETPYFEQSIKMIMDPTYMYDQKQVIIRHIFGSHEAHWAIHCDGWYEEKFKNVLSCLHFQMVTAKKHSWGSLITLP